MIVKLMKRWIRKRNKIDSEEKICNDFKESQTKEAKGRRKHKRGVLENKK